jgi:hypothetical protein
MILDVFLARAIMTYLLLFSMAIQALEYFYLRQYWSGRGPWSEQTLQMRSFVLRSDKVAWLVLILRVLSILGMLVLPSWHWILILLLSNVFYSMRFQGTFNGGSDMMSTVVLTGLLLAWWFENDVYFTSFGVSYVAVQALASYFIAGYIKVIKPNWRSGAALPVFIEDSIYGMPGWLTKWTSGRSTILWGVASWSVMIFELLFPLALLNTFATVLFCLVAFAFHGMNMYVFGLNRFIWAWAPSWVALIYLSLALAN